MANDLQLSARERRKQIIRNSILDASVHCFNAQGFSETTVTQIVERSGTTRQTFYTYFKTKGEVALALVSTLTQQLKPAFSIIDEKELPSPRTINKWAKAISKEWVEHAELLEAVFQALVIDRNVSLVIRDVSEQYAEELMPNYVASFSGKQREQALRRIRALNMYLQNYFHFIAENNVNEPTPASQIEELSDIGWRLLYLSPENDNP